MRVLKSVTAAALMFSLYAVAQDGPKPIDKIVTSNLSGYHLTGAVDSHGCFTTATYNPKNGRCENWVTIISPNSERVTCTLEKRGSIGEQPVICWYKPTGIILKGGGTK